MSLQGRASDARKDTRVSLYLAASLYCDGCSSPVKIRNISPTGALLESATSCPAGALVQLVRGSLIVHGLVAWSDHGRCGVNFSGSIDVQKWCAPPGNAEQERVDEIVRVVKAGAVPLPVSTASKDLADSANQAFSGDLQRVAELLARVGDRLAKDGIVVAQYATELQNLDIAMQVIATLKSMGTDHGSCVSDTTRMASLRKSADQALGR
jgi:hypothetical protein